MLKSTLEMRNWLLLWERVLVILTIFKLSKGYEPKSKKVVKMIEEENVARNIYDLIKKKKVWLGKIKGSAEVFYQTSPISLDCSIIKL